VIVAHRGKRAGIHRAVAKKFVDSAVELAGAGVCDDIDLTAAGAAHVRGVAAGFNLKFANGVWRGTEILRVECGIGVGGTIEKEKIGVGAATSNDNRGTLAGPPVERIGASSFARRSQRARRGR